MPLIHKKNSDFAAFIGAQSLQKPQEYEDPAATANANLSARLPYLFASSRFAHYLKCMVRDKVGSTMSKAQLEAWLHNWILQYVDGAPDNSSEDYKATHPLAEAAVTLEADEENPGYYSARIYLKPHYQLEGVNVSLRLVSRVPK
jgi:type VI secretion system protein ImpC